MSGNPNVQTAIHCAGPGCEAVKQQVNHWFLMTFLVKTMASEPEVVRVRAGRSSGVRREFRCRHLDGQDIRDEEKPVCGQQCAQKLFEAWLLGGK